MKSFFGQKTGATLEILQFFSQTKSRMLMRSLSKKTSEFYDKNRLNVNRVSSNAPAISSVDMKDIKEFEEFSTHSGKHNDHVTKIIHLKGDLFLICFRDFCFDLVDMAAIDAKDEADDIG